MLAVSRAIGDRALKPFVTAEPEIRHWPLGSRDRYLVLATDGVWDTISSEEAAHIVLAAHGDPQRAAQELALQAIERGSTDNVTAVVVDLKMRQRAEPVSPPTPATKSE